MRLKDITLCGFRGFNECQTINLDNEVVLIYGLNGSGKSSVVEALEWLFFDEISRKTRSKCKSEYKSEYLRNIHYSGTENPFVEATIKLNGQEKKIRKEIISTIRSRLFIGDAKVDNLSSLGISFEGSNKPILAQSEIQRFVDTEQKDRWTEIAKILGLDVFSKFREGIMSLKNKKENDDLFKSAKEVTNSAISDLKGYPDLGNLVTLIEAIPYKYSNLINGIKKTVQIYGKLETSDIPGIKQILKKKKDQIVQSISRPENIEKVQPTSDEISISEVEDIFSEMNDIGRELISLEEIPIDEERIQFLLLGLKFIKGETCPFCEEETITPKRKRDIERYIEKNKELFARYEQLNKRINRFSELKESILKSFKKQLPENRFLVLVSEDIERVNIYLNDAQKLEISQKRLSPPLTKISIESN